MQPNTGQPTETARRLTGGCLCGGFRYVLPAEPTALCDCHCIDCRRSSGAPFVTWGTVQRDGFKALQGELRRIPYADRIRGFAACCGTHVTFEDAVNAPTVDVAIATLDKPERWAPKKAIWVEDKLPWVTLNPDVPAFPQRSGAIG